MQLVKNGFGVGIGRAGPWFTRSTSSRRLELMDLTRWTRRLLKAVKRPPGWLAYGRRWVRGRSCHQVIDRVRLGTKRRSIHLVGLLMACSWLAGVVRGGAAAKLSTGSAWRRLGAPETVLPLIARVPNSCAAGPCIGVQARFVVLLVARLPVSSMPKIAQKHSGLVTQEMN